VTSTETADHAAEAYDPHAAEARWRPVWEALDLYRADTSAAAADKSYVLDMFPYPSGDLHIGHAEAFSIGDAVARFQRMQGGDVLHPIGWDSFGLPAENAAIARGLDPADWTYANIETQAEGFRRLATSFDWSRRLATSDPSYYRWTQWLFLRLWERDLAYRKASPVNWCPRDQTVLANEQVVAGLCERCGAEVTKRELTQWSFAITRYADRLLADMDQLEAGWPERVLTMQRNWIGRSVGAHVRFVISGEHLALPREATVFTTRPDTLHGATFFVVAADSPLAEEICAPALRPGYEAYRERVRGMTERDRLASDRDKTGVPLGVTAANPLTGEAMPVWAADYVLADYGTGAIMAVPAHDQRDLDFARAFDLPVRVVVDTGAPDPAETGVATTGDGVLVNSGRFDGLAKAEAVEAVTAHLAEAGLGETTVTYRLRDWLVSRQRYWGCPIPVVHCPSCGIVPVRDADLPVTLPPMSGAALLPEGQSPLASNRAWVETTCPSCAGPAERDTDTMDTFVDSSWYYLRFLSPGYEDGPVDPVQAARWLPVAQYVGGVEHAILHLLYARFIFKVCHDLGLVEPTEPFTALLNQGMVVNGGKAMSKSGDNGVDLQEQLALHGVDTMRLLVLFAGPPEEDVDWADMSPTGVSRQLARMVRACTDAAASECSGNGDPAGHVDGMWLLRSAAHIIDDITGLMQRARFNVAIARLMELTNALRKALGSFVDGDACREVARDLALMLAAFAPYTAEECWSRLGHDVEGGDSVHRARWPVAHPALLVEETVTCVVQVAGKVRDRLEVAPDVSAEALEALALASGAVQRALDGRAVRAVIVRAPKLVNIVPA